MHIVEICWMFGVVATWKFSYVFSDWFNGCECAFI